MTPTDWIVVAVLIIAGGAGSHFAARWVNLAWDARHARDFHRWEYELEQDIGELTRARLWVAACEQRLAGRLASDLPEKFENPVWQAARVGYAVEAAVLREAQRRGLYDPTVLAPVAVGPSPAQTAPEPAPDAPQGAPRPDPAPPAVPPPEATWEGGRLIPYRRRPRA